ncbi:MAG: 1,4-dihydroxy-2-naphthoate polyprenyltransferase [Chloroflexi bacterium]|jgi:1,4-dihydroxy-2-naphthoate octaprenyltransferase|nr:1,4-dihydroxy-2-naphthoate polyprenyltransferase [Chloroflexota bacterium]
MARSEEPSNNRKVWIEAVRPRTLPLAVASIVMGSALAAVWQPFNWTVAILCVLTAVLLQILSNLANDFGDSQHGADHARREGPKRAVQSGAISEKTMLRAIAIAALLSMVSGLALLWFAFGDDARELFILFVLLGALAIIAAIAYTAGFRPYGYAGLGDLSVLLFFGWLGVMGTYFLHTLRFDWLIIFPATCSGLLAVAVLNVNNIRDAESDRLAGKRTISVRIGPKRARVYHWMLLATAVLCACVYALLVYSSLWQFLFVLAVPLLIKNGLAVWRTQSPREINPLLKQLSLVTLLFVLLFSVGQLL